MASSDTKDEVYTELTEKVRLFVLTAVKKERYEHSVRTAQTAALLCRRYGENEARGYFCGIAHDICKEMDSETLLSLSREDGFPVSDVELAKLSLLHGRAAAVFLHKRFNVTDADILEAIRYHTFGKPGMCDLAKIVYIADKIEPGREYSSDEYIQKLMEFSLDDVLYNVLEKNIEYLKKQDKTVAFPTLDLFASLEGNKTKGNKNAEI